jgi:protein SCO1/2
MSENVPAGAAQDPVRKIPAWIWWLIVLEVAIAVTVPLYLFLRHGLKGWIPREKPIGAVADFYLTERSGQPFRRADLIGKVWVADFIFTRCQGPCPILSKTMAKLQKALPDEVRLVSFSVDPEYDTPPVLTDYAAKYGAQEGRWFFLTAKKQVVYDVIRKNFKLPSSSAADGGITHSDRIVLVDRQGKIRAYFEGTDEKEIPRLLTGARQLLDEK